MYEEFDTQLIHLLKAEPMNLPTLADRMQIIVKISPHIMKHIPLRDKTLYRMWILIGERITALRNRDVVKEDFDIIALSEGKQPKYSIKGHNYESN